MPSFLTPSICNRWDSWLNPLPAATMRIAGPAPHLGNTVELTQLTGTWVSHPRECEHGRPDPLFTCHMGDALCPTLHHLWQVRKLDLRSRKLESRPCTCPWQHSRANPDDGGARELKSVSIGELVPVLTCHAAAQVGAISTLTTWSRHENRPLGHKSGGAGTALLWLQQL